MVSLMRIGGIFVNAPISDQKLKKTGQNKSAQPIFDRIAGFCQAKKGGIRKLSACIFAAILILNSPSDCVYYTLRRRKMRVFKRLGVGAVGNREDFYRTRYPLT